jgi:hypothetical protein
MEKSTPDFAIFQNSRTQASAMWVKEVGDWKRYAESDYGPILIMANMLRQSDNPEFTLKQIRQVILSLSEERE